LSHHHQLALQPYVSLGLLCYSPPLVSIQSLLNLIAAKKKKEKKEEEAISKENIFKHSLLSDLIRFISVYFQRNANFTTISFKFAPAGRNLLKVELRESSIT
jgi:hypothetical protein